MMLHEHVCQPETWQCPTLAHAAYPAMFCVGQAVLLDPHAFQAASSPLIPAPKPYLWHIAGWQWRPRCFLD